MKRTLFYVLRNPFSRKSFLANTAIIIDGDGFMFDNMLIPYETDAPELLEDWEIGQYLGGN